jgi:hypothetical protein
MCKNYKMSSVINVNMERVVRTSGLKESAFIYMKREITSF